MQQKLSMYFWNQQHVLIHPKKILSYKNSNYFFTVLYMRVPYHRSTHTKTGFFKFQIPSLCLQLLTIQLCFGCGLLKLNCSFCHCYGHIGDRQKPGAERQSPTQTLGTRNHRQFCTLVTNPMCVTTE